MLIASILYALLLLGCWWLAASMVGLRLFGATRRALRWCACGVLCIWTAICVFDLLAALGRFRAVEAAVATLAVALLARLLTRVSMARAIGLLISDLSALAELSFARRDRAVALAGWSIVALAACLSLRAVLLPPMSWDWVTYHGVKAGLFVQSGGRLPLLTPGGWSMYRDYPFGGEALCAWAMLPFHSDALIGIFEIALWLLFWPVLVELGRALDVPQRLRRPAALYGMCIPALLYTVGNGWAELPLWLMYLSGLLFMLRALGLPERDAADAPKGAGALSLAAFGAAGAIRVTALAGLLLAALFIAIRSWRRCGLDRRAWAGLALGLGLGCAAAGPWMLRSTLELSRPFSPYGFELGGLVLGRVAPALAWYMDRPGLSAFNLHQEIDALLSIFGMLVPLGAHFGQLSPLFVAALPAALYGRWRRNPLAAIALAALLLLPLLLFYSDQFDVVRLRSGGVNNARFLYGFIVTALLLAAGLLKRPWQQQAGRAVLLGSALLYAAIGLTRVPAAFEWPWLLAGLALAAVVITVAALLRGRDLRRGAVPALSAALLLCGVAGMAGLAQVRESLRDRALLSSPVWNKADNYWAAAIPLTDRPDEPLRIAVAAGPLQNAHNELMYFFLGRRLQNNLEYVPIRADGSIAPYVSYQGIAPELLDRAAWLRRLERAGVTHVISFTPATTELAWMEAQPELFERLAGVPGLWGLFGVQR